MSEKVQGTLELNGLIEGPMPESGEPETVINSWCSGAQKLGLHFSVEIEGGKFSLLADTTPISVAGLEREPIDVITGGLSELVEAFPPQQRPHIFSTLRSVEYLVDQEVQTLYFVGPDGSVQTRSRTVSAKTTPPPKPVPVKHRLVVAASGVLVAAVILLVSSLFVDYRSLISGLIERGTPLKVQDIQVEAGAFSDYFTLGEGSFVEKSIQIPVTRNDGFPTKDDDFAKLLVQADGSLSKRLAIEALAAGYVRAEFYNKKGELLGFDFYPLGLKDQKESKLRLSLPAGGRPARIVIRY